MKRKGHQKAKQYTSEYIASLYQRYARKLYHSAFRYTSNKSTAEDGVQLVFEKLLSYPTTALEVPEDEILYFLFAVLRNVMYTITKDEAKNSHFSLEYNEYGDRSLDLIDPEDVIIRVIHLECIRNMFSHLTPELCDTMVFHYCYGLKYQEIAAIFHISERAVKKRIAVAKKQIKTMFRKEDFL